MTIVVVSIDGFGIGNMHDTNKQSNTFLTLLKNAKQTDFPFLKKVVKAAKKLALDYEGADSFLGHLTMSGVNVNNIVCEPLLKNQDAITHVLTKNGFNVHNNKGILVVEDKFIIYDNFEAENGLALNIAANFDTISFPKLMQIAQKIRQVIKNPRLIAFGTNNLKLENYLKHRVFKNEFRGITTAASGVYDKNFKVHHFGAPINFKKSMQSFALLKGYQVYLYGKFADIISFANQNLKRFLEIKSSSIFKIVNTKLAKKTFHCINIQQTDLRGHAGDVKGYIKVLNEIDNELKKLAQNNDVHLIITADHGNDPAIKDGKHTREFVPFWTNQKTPNVLLLSQVAVHIKNLIIKN